MFRLLQQFGDLLDRIDLAGWTLTLSGIVVVAVTVLTPAYLEVRAMEVQRAVLRHAEQRTEAHYQNYVAFHEALQNNDPLLLERLAWHHLRMRPEGSETVETVIENPWLVPSVDQWVAPPAVELETPEALELPDSTLVRLILGDARPWVLAFGAWLILMGLMINPTVPVRDEDDGEEDDP